MSKELNNSIGFKINQTANKINQDLNNLLKKYNIGLEQRLTLEIIKEDKNITQSKITSILKKDKTTISRALNSLEKKGFIKKEENKDDKRVKFINITSKAYEVLEKTDLLVKEFRNNLANKLEDKDIDTLFKILNKLNT
ncbi:MarR family winged helix-turn-helix transcriptional regulator [Arcobacter sp. CECT 8985]|uniref:MarR family winged helix-turn-helix transcriptional regulator n=1 Tax=Arcobacter sp. CECT 8985 TaxID=1935424 RepID=UPI00100B2638|nr:MarR family transcriptional regulator [Arcobacter sp. CECT 8985]RXJ84059.1 hypothetical protein CRU93_13005 [Arcobacter sp. CECT 8985]